MARVPMMKFFSWPGVKSIGHCSVSRGLTGRLSPVAVSNSCLYNVGRPRPAKPEVTELSNIVGALRSFSSIQPDERQFPAEPVVRRPYHTCHHPHLQPMRRPYANDFWGKLPTREPCFILQFQPSRSMAGHSKWSNIRHIKGAKDAQKSSTAQKMSRKLKIAIREGGGTDPKFNYQLARVIQQASAADVPKSTIEAALRSIEKSSTEGSPMTFEAKGPGGCWLIIDAFTDSPKRIKLEIHTIFKKLGGQMGDRLGFASHAFDYKGVILLPPGGGIESLEAAEEAAIMAEAEEVEQIENEEGYKLFQFICDPKEVYNVRKQLVEHAPDADFDLCKFVYFPQSYLVLPEPVLEAAGRLLDGLEALPDVLHVYTNIKAEGED